MQMDSILRIFDKNGIKYQIGWSNYTSTLNHPNNPVIDVDNEQQLSKIVQLVKEFNDASENKFCIRTVAGYRDITCHCFWCCIFPFLRGQHIGVENKYNESFSWTGASVGDIFIRFSPKFHKVKIKNGTAIVTAGTQLKKVVDILWGKGYSLPTASMIYYVTAVGLAATAGHGTGRYQPSFAGLIQNIRICDQEGNYVNVKNNHPDFATIRGGHFGMYGIVTEITVRIIPRFYLQETRIPLSFSSLKGSILEMVAEHDYTTLIAIPTYKKLQLRIWDRIEKPREKIPTKIENKFEDVVQHFSVKVGAEILNLISKHNEDNEAAGLVYTFLQLVGASEIGHQIEHLKDSEKRITHQQISFPEELEDYSLIFPIDLGNNEDTNNLIPILEYCWNLLEEYASKKQYPVTFAMYARFFKGTKGGLSTSGDAVGDKQITCALEFVTHKLNPFFGEFRETLTKYFLNNVKNIKFHLGKYVPPNLTIKDLYSQEVVEDLHHSLVNWYGSEESLKDSLFLNDYLKKFLTLDEILLKKN